MRARLVFDDAAAYAAIRADLDVTAGVEGGAGPVRLGVAAPLSDGRVQVAHVFSEADVDWIVAYTDDPRLSVEWEE